MPTYKGMLTQKPTQRESHSCCLMQSQKQKWRQMEMHPHFWTR